MQLKCKLQADRNGRPYQSLSGQGIVTIGKAKNGNVMIHASSSKNKEGVRFEAGKNIVKTYEKFLRDGKLTIQFRNPDLHLIISKVDEAQLKRFLRLLAAVDARKSKENENPGASDIGKLKSVKAKDLKPAPKSITITSREEIPGLEGFPRDLTTLRYSGCKLLKIDQRIVKLRHLISLDLADNQLGGKPESLIFDEFTALCYLDLSLNMLGEATGGELPSTFWDSLPVTVQELRINSNYLKRIPNSIRRLTSLKVLNAQMNELDWISPELGNLSSLRDLYLSVNQLTYIPMSFTRLKLRHLELGRNNPEAYSPPPLLAPISETVPVLSELAEKIIFDKKIATHQLPPRHSFLIQQLTPCVYCSKACLPSGTIVKYSYLDLRRIATTLVMEGGGGRFVRTLGMCCSNACGESVRLL